MSSTHLDPAASSISVHAVCAAAAITSGTLNSWTFQGVTEGLRIAATGRGRPRAFCAGDALVLAAVRSLWSSAGVSPRRAAAWVGQVQHQLRQCAGATTAAGAAIEVTLTGEEGRERVRWCTSRDDTAPPAGDAVVVLRLDVGALHARVRRALAEHQACAGRLRA